MDKIVLRTSATEDDMWNALIDVMYDNRSYDNEVLDRLFTVMDYYNEMEKGLHEGFIEYSMVRVQNEGFDRFSGYLIHALEYIDAEAYVRIVRTHFPALFDLYFRYEGALNNSREIKSLETDFMNAVNQADDAYQELDGLLHSHITRTIKQKKHYIFE